jgi:uncharacterized membrane protein
MSADRVVRFIPEAGPETGPAMEQDHAASADPSAPFGPSGSKPCGNKQAPALSEARGEREAGCSAVAPPVGAGASPGHATTLGNALVLGGALLAALAAVQRYTHVLSAPGSSFVLERERCHGVVRAGRNDCGTSLHACAGQAREDRGAQEWILLPAGTCERIAGGRLRTGGG